MTLDVATHMPSESPQLLSLIASTISFWRYRTPYITWPNFGTIIPSSHFDKGRPHW